MEIRYTKEIYEKKGINSKRNITEMIIEFYRKFADANANKTIYRVNISSMTTWE